MPEPVVSVSGTERGHDTREVEAVAWAIASRKLHEAADNAERNAILGDAYNDAKRAIDALDAFRRGS